MQFNLALINNINFLKKLSHLKSPQYQCIAPQIPPQHQEKIFLGSQMRAGNIAINESLKN